MAEKHHVIIGNGPAGRAAAAVLREKDPSARITVVSKDSHSHYVPMFLPDYIAGRSTMEDLIPTPFTFYAEKDVKLRTGQEVVGLDLEAGRLHLEHKEIIPFTGLIIAVGGRPRIPEPLFVYRDLMMTLKTVADARKWVDRLKDVDTVLLVGGDLTSFAVTRALLDLGKKVRFVFSEGAFWPMRCNEDIVRSASERLAARGVEVIEGHLKSVVRRSESRYQVETDRVQTEAGMVGAFFGLVPDIRFLAGSGLQIERGILVDEYLNAGSEGVYAAGDCAQVYHPEIKDYWVSIGYKNAKSLGRIAALNLLGGAEEARVAPESIFYDHGVRANTSWWMEF